MKLAVTFALSGFLVLSCVTQLSHNKITAEEAPVSYSFHIVPVAQDSLNTQHAAPYTPLQNISL